MNVTAYRMRLAVPGGARQPIVGLSVTHLPGEPAALVEAFDVASGLAVIRLRQPVHFQKLEEAGVPWDDFVDFE